jgi:hypothetical protein
MISVPVGRFDRRALLAARTALRVPACERRALHVAAEPDAVEQLERDWIVAQHDELPLHIVDNAGGIAATVAGEIEKLAADGWRDIVLVLGELRMRGLSRRLLHDRTAASIAAAVRGIDGVTVITVPVHIGR